MDQNDGQTDVMLARVKAPASRVGINRRQGEEIFDDELKAEYCRLVSETGVLGKTAEAVGITAHTAVRHRRQDPVFNQAVEDAMASHRDKIDLAVQRRAIDGIKEDIYDTAGRKVGHKIKYSDSLLALYAKRHNSAYKERVEVDAHVQQAVLVVQAPTVTVGDMEEQARRIALEQQADESGQH